MGSKSYHNIEIVYQKSAVEACKSMLQEIEDIIYKNKMKNEGINSQYINSSEITLAIEKMLNWHESELQWRIAYNKTGVWVERKHKL